MSTPSRPLAELGGVTTLPGDLYLNFGLAGMILLMFVLARFSAQLYQAAYGRPYASVSRFGFLLVASSLVQIYRDGLISIPVFLLVQLLPLMVVFLLHWRKPSLEVGLAQPLRAA